MPQNQIVRRQIMEVLAMTIIGDSALCIAFPEEHTALWQRGPEVWQDMVEPFMRHPAVTRAFGLAGVAFGLWMANRQYEEAIPPRASARRFARKALAAMS